MLFPEKTEWLMLFGCSVGLLGLEQSSVVKLSHDMIESSCIQKDPKVNVHYTF